MLYRAKMGFTLIELLIVVAIIGILAAIAVPNFINAQIRARVSHSLSELRTYKDIQKMYFMDHGDVPPHFDGKDEHCPYINLGYISTALTDPFAEQNPDAFLYHQGMYHSTHVRNPNSIQKINPSLWDEWKSAGKGYIIFGEGPAGSGGWIDYSASNGIISGGQIIGVSIRGKGLPGEGLGRRTCN